MRAHQIRHQILLLLDLAGVSKIPAGKLNIRFNMGLAHFVQHRSGAVLRCHFQLAAHMVLHQLPKEAVIRVAKQIIIANTAADKHFLDSIHLPQRPKNVQIFSVIRLQIRAWFRRQAFFALAQAVLLLQGAAGVAEVGGGAAHIMNIALEVRHLGNLLRFNQQAFFAARGHITPLVECNGTEIASAETSPIVGNGKAHFFNTRHTAQLLITGMVRPHIRQAVHPVQLRGRQRLHRRILHHHYLAVALLEQLAPHMILLVLLQSARAGIFLFRGTHILKGGTLYPAKGCVFGGHRIHGAPNVMHTAHRLTRSQAAGNLRYLLLSHTVDQQISAGVHQRRGSNGVVPVIVMGKAAQGRLQPA